MTIRNLYLPLLFPLMVAIAFSQLKLMDRTESRVAIVSNHLLEQHDIFHLFVPKEGSWVNYWAKPPLQYWLVASSIAIFGKHEISTRLPSLLAGCGTLLLMRLFRRKTTLAPYIAASAVIFFGVHGTALIDGTLTFGLTLTLLGLYRWMIEGDKKLSSILLMSIGTVLSCALKGLVGLAIPALTVIIFTLLSKEASAIYRLPWLKAGGIIITALIGYYGIIEWHNPGYCEYFFINENILRFLTKDYGDRTGSGHAQLYGTSIVFFFLSFLPWTPLLIKSLCKFRPSQKDEFFFMSGLLAPIFLFLFAKQHLATYQLPAIVPAALLLGDRLNEKLVKRVTYFCLGFYTIGTILTSSYFNHNFSSAHIINESLLHDQQKIRFQYETPFSAYWYAPSYESLDGSTPDQRNGYFIVREKHQKEFSDEFGASTTLQVSMGKWHLYSSTASVTTLPDQPKFNH